MAYVKVGPWVNGGAPALSATNLDTIETQYDEAVADLATHATLDTGVHGAGASTLATEADLTVHTDLTTAHGAVSTATASKMVVRDASGRTKFAAPNAAGDALIKGTRVTVAELPAVTDEKILKGTGGSMEEVDWPDLATHTGVAAAHHAKTTSFADMTDRAGVSKLGWASGKLLKGAGVTSDPVVLSSYSYSIAASDSLKHSNDTQQNFADGSYTKQKETHLDDLLPGNIRIKFDLEAGPDETVYGRLYRNGGVIGSERTTSGGWVTYSEDFDASSWVIGDLIQVYCWTDDGSFNSSVIYLRIYYDLTFIDAS